MIIMSNVSLKISVDDAKLLFNLVNQVSAQGKESIQQVLKIMEALEAVIPEETNSPTIEEAIANVLESKKE